MNRARYHLYMNPTNSQNAMRLKPGPRIMRGRRDEPDSTNPADFNVSKRSRIFSSLLIDRGSSCCFLKAICVEVGRVVLTEESGDIVRRGKGANACVTANKARHSQHIRLKRSILLGIYGKDLNVCFPKTSQQALPSLQVGSMHHASMLASWPKIQKKISRWKLRAVLYGGRTDFIGSRAVKFFDNSKISRNEYFKISIAHTRCMNTFRPEALGFLPAIAKNCPNVLLPAWAKDEGINEKAVC